MHLGQADPEDVSDAVGLFAGSGNRAVQDPGDGGDPDGDGPGSAGLPAMMTGESIVCVSSIDWGFNWQAHQEIMSMLSASGNHVLFVENTGVRAPTIRDLPRLRQRLRNWRRGRRGIRQERERLTIYSPLALPFPYSRSARRVNRWILGRAIRRWMRMVGCVRPIVWTFLPTPVVHDLIRDLDAILTIYYCADDLPSSSPPARRLERSEPQLFRTADLVFVTAEKLRVRAARFRDDVQLFPGGVNYAAFERVRDGQREPPETLEVLSRPIVGYVGGLNQKVDQELLVDVAGRLPEVSFALVGPIETDVSSLRCCPNIHLLGPRPHPEVPSYIREFAVGIVPYRLTEYTLHVYPVKVGEYLAMGIPVVSTDLPEIRRFSAAHGNVVATASGAEAFGRAIREALTNGASSEAVLRRIKVARQNTWDQRISEMSTLIERRVAMRRGGGGRV